MLSQRHVCLDEIESESLPLVRHAKVDVCEADILAENVNCRQSEDLDVVEHAISHHFTDPVIN